MASEESNWFKNNPRNIRVGFMLSFLLLFFAPLLLHGQSNQSIRSLSDKWTVYNYSLEGYVPYLPDYQNNTRTIYMQLPYEQYRGSYISWQVPAQSHLFIDNQLTRILKQEQPFLVNMDSMQRERGRDILQVSIYRETGFESGPPVNIVSKALPSPLEQVNEAAVEGETFEIFNAHQRSIRNYLLIFSLNILFVFGVLIRRLSPLNNFLAFTDFVSQLFSYKVQDIKYSTLSVILFMLYYGFTATFILLFIRENSVYFNEQAFLFYNISSNIVVASLQLFSIVMLFVVGKLLLIWIAGQLYGLNTEADVHLFEYIRITQFLITLFLLLGFLLNIYPYVFNIKLFIYFIFFSLMLKSFIISLRLSRIISFKKVYLISYFCITEFLLVFVSIKFFVKV